MLSETSPAIIPEGAQLIQAYLVWPMDQEVWFEGKWVTWREVKDFYSVDDFVIVKDFV